MIEVNARDAVHGRLLKFSALIGAITKGLRNGPKGESKGVRT